jgi:acyl-lipid omega-6 desaturase (Delta-12 desaturase)
LDGELFRVPDQRFFVTLGVERRTFIMKTEEIKTKTGEPGWRDVVSGYNFPDVRKSIWQLVDSIVPFIGLWILMYYSMGISYWITLALAIPAAGFMVRIFIIFHDCGHKSFFKSAKWNEWVGFFTGLFTFTPYHSWHRSHNKHHATVGNLDKRGVGDVLTMTIGEYKSAPLKKRIFYRIYRNPVVMFLIAAPLIFIVQNRVFTKKMQPREKWSIVLTNIALILIIGGLGLLIGFKTFILIQLPVFYLASVWGVWLFYVQHQYIRVNWYRDREWDYQTVALNGCSFYKLPRLLQWFSGHIGFHHVHHLSSRIPNYKLERCHRENEIFKGVRPLSFRASLKSLRLRLWDEQAKKLVSFREAWQPA